MKCDCEYSEKERRVVLACGAHLNWFKDETGYRERKSPVETKLAASPGEIKTMREAERAKFDQIDKALYFDFEYFKDLFLATAPTASTDEFELALRRLASRRIYLEELVTKQHETSLKLNKHRDALVQQRDDLETQLRSAEKMLKTHSEKLGELTTKHEMAIGVVSVRGDRIDELEKQKKELKMNFDALLNDRNKLSNDFADKHHTVIELVKERDAINKSRADGNLLNLNLMKERELLAQAHIETLDTLAAERMTITALRTECDKVAKSVTVELAEKKRLKNLFADCTNTLKLAVEQRDVLTEKLADRDRSLMLTNRICAQRQQEIDDLKHLLEDRSTAFQSALAQRDELIEEKAQRRRRDLHPSAAFAAENLAAAMKAATPAIGNAGTEVTRLAGGNVCAARTKTSNSMTMFFSHETDRDPIHLFGTKLYCDLCKHCGALYMPEWQS